MRKRTMFTVLLLTLACTAACSAMEIPTIGNSGFTPDLSALEETYDRGMDICISKCISECGTKARDCTDSAEFIADITVPDGSVFAPGETFRKVWRLKNTGTCTWDRSYKVISSGSFHMGGRQSVYLNETVEPGETADIGMELTAPVVYGNFKSEYMLEDGNGSRFGITGPRTKKEMPFWLKLKVEDPSACSIVRVSPYSVWRYSDFDAVFRIKNNSDSAWNPDEIDVKVTAGREYLKYPGKYLIDLPETVEPGGAGTIIFDMIAPDFQGDSEITIQLLNGNDVVCSVTNRITFE